MGLFTENCLTVFMMQQVPKTNLTSAWLTVVGSEETKNFIVELNTEDQLFLQGIDSTGTSLKEIGGNEFTDSGYSPLTIELKRAKGGKAGRVENITLYDTGDYYESHEVKVSSSGFEIDADPQKDDTNLFDEWGDDIVGLTDESLQKLITFLLKKYLIYTRDTVFS